jgi:hypothetical protein
MTAAMLSLSVYTKPKKRPRLHKTKLERDEIHEATLRWKVDTHYINNDLH